MRSLTIFAAVLMPFLCATQAVAETHWRFTDVHDKLHDPFSKEQIKAIVLVFVTTDCPVANYYQPTLSRLTEQYKAAGVPVYLFHSDRDTKLAEAIAHAKDFSIKAPVILDHDQEIAKRVEARVTPEAFLIDRAGKIRYRGRIDDLYADYGKRRSTPKNHDLKDAIDSLLAGKEIKNPKTKAVGCYIPYAKKTSQPSDSE